MELVLVPSEIDTLPSADSFPPILWTRLMETNKWWDSTSGLAKMETVTTPKPEQKNKCLPEPEKEL